MKSVQVLLSVVVAASSVWQTASSASCHHPFQSIGGHCLYIDPLESGTWYDMRFYCSGLAGGADLACIKDANTLQAVIEYIKDFGLDHSNYWVGARDEKREMDWEWVDATSVHLGAPIWKYDCSTDIKAVNASHPLRPQQDTSKNCGALELNSHFHMSDFPCLGDGGDVVFSPICEDRSDKPYTTSSRPTTMDYSTYWFQD